MEQNEVSAEELRRYQKQYQVEHSIGDLTPTICELFGVRKPAQCGGMAIASVMDQAYHLMQGAGKAEKALIFCPDACGEIQRRHCPELFEQVQKAAGLKIPSAAVMPSVTPVCYGTIFSGASPAVHGIQRYEKPVLNIETLFDVFAEAEKNVAVCAFNNCSIDRIFRQRNIDYYSFRSDEAAFECTRNFLLHSYDVIVLYMAGYDAVAHKKGVFAPESIQQLELAAQRFSALCRITDDKWKNFNRVIVFAPDHGQHPVDEIHGGHGENIFDDMVVNHYYRICEGEKQDTRPGGFRNGAVLPAV